MDKNEDVREYISNSVELLTGVPTKVMLKSVGIKSIFDVHVNEDQLEFLTREGGSALSALVHVVSVICIKHSINGEVIMTRLDKGE